MKSLWPVFHDPSYKPSSVERLSLHWQANLRMLRRPRDIVLFTLISFVPLLLLVGFQTLFPNLYSVSISQANPTRDVAPLLLAALVTMLAFLVLQHFAFLLAINLTYLHHVRSVLLDRGVPLCVRCAHLLPPQTPEAACPECGATPPSATMSDSNRKASIDDPTVMDSEDSPR
ncbi:MAG: hypothetical protein CMJ52_04250 [Planctomycetaceae bacterium]|nr:hypothetical protein [Planctomycetaceae bacterium]